MYESVCIGYMACQKQWSMMVATTTTKRYTILSVPDSCCAHDPRYISHHIHYILNITFEKSQPIPIILEKSKQISLLN